MPRRNSTVEIVDGKVVFSKEVLSYFDNLRTEENSIWIIEGYAWLKTKHIPNSLHLKKVMFVRFPASQNFVVLHRHL